jgi:hypothetical protein
MTGLIADYADQGFDSSRLAISSETAIGEPPRSATGQAEQIAPASRCRGGRSPGEGRPGTIRQDEERWFSAPCLPSETPAQSTAALVNGPRDAPAAAGLAVLKLAADLIG